VLHPHYKLNYFSKARWPQEWITTAVSILQVEWETNYKPAQTTSGLLATNADNTSTSMVMSVIILLCIVPMSFMDLQGAEKYFESLDDVEVSSDPISDWINSPPILLAKDPIAYWTGMDATGHPLACMSLDFLSIPGVSCSPSLTSLAYFILS
jgi:hypothetical protein